ncbi:MAG: hypothetical protein ABIH68_02420 [bacterium]
MNRMILKMGRQKPGFSYIEIILAAAIIAYVALSFTQSLINNIKSAKMSEFKTTAYNKAVNWIEENRRNYEASVLDTTTWTIAETGELAAGVDYTLRKQITLSALGDNGEYKEISVEVNWIEGGREKSVEFSTIKSKYAD